jgi:hypothetical protein
VEVHIHQVPDMQPRSTLPPQLTYPVESNVAPVLGQKAAMGRTPEIAALNIEVDDDRRRNHAER